MGEGFRGGEPPESRPSAPSADFERADKGPSPLERLVAQRWETLNESLEAFREKEADDTLDPEHFMTKTMEAWERKHAGGEYVDTMSPFDRLDFLLGQLVEEGAEWSAQKRAAVRRTLYDFAQQSLGAMTLQQQGILKRTILQNSKIGEIIGRPKPNEQKLIRGWMQDTVGRGVK